MTILPEAAYPYMDIGEAAIMMMDKEISFLPVVEEEKIIGILYSEDIYRTIEQENEPQPTLTGASSF